MRISIWQQFSSNHSSRFTVVGEFESVESAQQAAEKLRATASIISAWYTLHPDIAERAIENYEVPTEIERIIGRYYSIPVTVALDWIANGGFNENTIRVYDQLVFFNGDVETNAGEAIFDQLMAKFTPRVYVNVEAAQGILASIECAAPKEAAALYIRHTILEYFKEEKIFKTAPWTISASDTQDLMTMIHNGATLSTRQGKLLVDGVRVTISNIYFNRIAMGLPALIAWLQDQGCSDIYYTLEQD